MFGKQHIENLADIYSYTKTCFSCKKYIISKIFNEILIFIEYVLQKEYILQCFVCRICLVSEVSIEIFSNMDIVITHGYINNLTYLHSQWFSSHKKDITVKIIVYIHHQLLPHTHTHTYRLQTYTYHLHQLEPLNEQRTKNRDGELITHNWRKNEEKRSMLCN